MTQDNAEGQIDMGGEDMMQAGEDGVKVQIGDIARAIASKNGKLAEFELEFQGRLKTSSTESAAWGALGKIGLEADSAWLKSIVTRCRNIEGDTVTLGPKLHRALFDGVTITVPSVPTVDDGADERKSLRFVLGMAKSLQAKATTLCRFVGGANPHRAECDILDGEAAQQMFDDVISNVRKARELVDGAVSELTSLEAHGFGLRRKQSRSIMGRIAAGMSVVVSDSVRAEFGYVYTDEELANPKVVGQEAGGEIVLLQFRENTPPVPVKRSKLRSPGKQR